MFQQRVGVLLHTLTICLTTAISLSAAADENIDDYVRAGMASNLALQQKQIDYTQSLMALKSARSAFYPSVVFETRHSLAGGGREFEVPTGTLLNPTNAALNELLGTDLSTTIENDVFNVIREEDHVTTLTVAAPIYQPALQHDYRSKRDRTFAEEAGKAAFGEELKKEIRIACLRFIELREKATQMQQVAALMGSKQDAVRQLINHGDADEVAALDAEADAIQAESDRLTLSTGVANAQRYLNFLVNRDLDHPVHLPVMPFDVAVPTLLASDIIPYGIENRRWDYVQLANAYKAISHSIDASKSAWKPEVAGVLEVGYEGEDTDYIREDPFWRASLVVKWHLFRGFGNQARTRSLMLDRTRLALQRTELEKQIHMDVLQVVSELRIGLKKLESAKRRLDARRRKQAMLEDRHAARQATKLDVIQAQIAGAQAEIAQITAAYAFFIKDAEVRHALAILDND